MKLRTPLSLFLPLALSACVTLPEIGTDHPAHPDAAQAHPTPLSDTLFRQEPTISEGTAAMVPFSAMSHDHGTDESGQAMPESEKQATLYTCPMDPEVVQDKPGKCPVCGMRLKPMPAETNEKGDGHDRDR